jgi:hypothetical protein
MSGRNALSTVGPALAPIAAGRSPLGRLAVVIRSAHARQATSTKRARRLPAVEDPRCGDAEAPGHPGRPVVAGARLAAAVHQGRNSQSKQPSMCRRPIGTPARSSGAAEAMTDDLPFRVVRSNGTDEVLVRAMNLLIARGAYREAARLYPEDLIEPRQGARIVEKSKP